MSRYEWMSRCIPDRICGVDDLIPRKAREDKEQRVGGTCTFGDDACGGI